MTCIVGIAEGGTVWIGSDSLCQADGLILTLARPKVFLNGEFLIGGCGYPRMLDILQYHLKVPAQEALVNDYRYIVVTFVEAVRETFKRLGFSHVQSNQEHGGFFMVGYRGQLYTIESNYQVTTYENGVNVIGSGMHYALGALAVLPTFLSPEERILKALGAADLLCATVAPPFHVEHISKGS